jgi:hypothetical protein
MSSDEASRNGSMPMLTRRATAPAASFVCRVLKHQMAGQGGLDGDGRGLGVADFAHQHDVRILPQNGAQARREGQPDVRRGLHLVDARRAGTPPDPPR